MKHYKNLSFIGTSHVATESIKEVKREILASKPEIVAIELDRNRFLALTNKDKISEKKLKKGTFFKAIKEIGFKGYLFSLAGSYFEKKLGAQTGVSPGDEMLCAYFAAKEINAKVALIDQDISITLKRFSQKFSWKEKFRLFRDMFKSLFMPKKMMKKYGISNFDLHKVPSQDMINKMTGYLKDNYPNVHQVLIVERNKVIANNLYKLINFYPDKKIIAVLGAGHVDDVIDLIKDFEKGRKDGV